jgi:type II secretory pathway pseudopilin PulG
MRYQYRTGLPPAARRHAFTTIEALVAATILAILTAAVSGALMAGRGQSKAARDTLAASFLAQSLMDEIVRLPFNDPQGYTSMGPDPGESRATFDNVDDYCGYTDGGTSTFTDLAGNPYPDSYMGFTRTVSMAAISTAPAGWNRTLTGLLITVSVTKDGSELIRLQRIAWN